MRAPGLPPRIACSPARNRRLWVFALIAFPALNRVALRVGVVIVIGLLTYAARGLYWSVLERGDVPARITGLAIGIISLLGYVACVSAVGGGACLVLKAMLKADARQ